MIYQVRGIRQIRMRAWCRNMVSHSRWMGIYQKFWVKLLKVILNKIIEGMATNDQNNIYNSIIID